MDILSWFLEQGFSTPSQPSTTFGATCCVPPEVTGNDIIASYFWVFRILEARKHRRTLKILNLNMKAGESVKIKGKICHNTSGFGINLGRSFSDLGLHFNPRFNPAIIVCNSRVSNGWQTEQNDYHVPFCMGSEVKFVISFLGNTFRVKLPDGHTIDFPNRHCYDVIPYLSVTGEFKVISFKHI